MRENNWQAIIFFISNGALSNSSLHVLNCPYAGKMLLLFANFENSSCLIFNRKLLIKADFMLLLTFCCFFIFVGNIGRIESVKNLLSNIIAGREMVLSALLSQVISNVPAAVLLSGFTESGRELLLGVNIGGLGTPIASLASLISMKIYASGGEGSNGKFLKLFLPVNFALLALMLLAAWVIY